LPTPYDVPPSVLIERLARHLKEEVDEITPPASPELAFTLKDQPVTLTGGSSDAPLFYVKST